MINQLTKAEQNALMVSYDVNGNQVELDLDFVKRYLVRGKAETVSDQEIVLFMNTCKMQNLNPLVNGEVYLIKYSAEDPAQIQVGKGAYLRRAFEHPQYLSKLDGITVKRGNEIIQKEGCCVYPGEELLAGWCKVFFERGGKERIAYKEADLKEYNKNMANWKNKPATMINKVAISQCLREAFPKDYEGLYSEEELVASGVIPYEEIAPADVVIIDEPITQEMRRNLFEVAHLAFGKEEGNELVKSIIEELGLESTTGMTNSIYEVVMEKINERMETYEVENAGDSDSKPQYTESE